MDVLNFCNYHRFEALIMIAWRNNLLQIKIFILTFILIFHLGYVPRATYFGWLGSFF